MPDLVVTASAALAVTAQAETDAARTFAMAEKSDATRRAYRSDFAIFTAWCGARGVASLPATPQTVQVFLASQAIGKTKASTLGRRVAAIRYAHKLAGHRAADELGTGQGRAARHPPHHRRRTGTERPGHRRSGCVDGRRDPRHAGGPAGPRPVAAGLRWRVPPIRAGGADGRRPDRCTGRDPRPDPQVRRPTRKAPGRRSPSRPAASCVPSKPSRHGWPRPASPRGRCSVRSTAAAGCCPTP